MLWHQSLKSIHYRTLLIFLNKKQQIRGSKHGGDKRHVIPPPPCQNMGGSVAYLGFCFEEGSKIFWKSGRSHAFVRGVPGHAPPRKFLKMVQFGAF